MQRRVYFSLPFQNQDLFFMELDGIKEQDLFESKINQINELLEKQSTAEKVLVHLDETKLNSFRRNQLVSMINKNKNKFSRICFVGINGFDKLQFRSDIKKKCGINCVIENDYQKAKELIVSKEIINYS